MIEGFLQGALHVICTFLSQIRHVERLLDLLFFVQQDVLMGVCVHMATHVSTCSRVTKGGWGEGRKRMHLSQEQGRAVKEGVRQPLWPVGARDDDEAAKGKEARCQCAHHPTPTCLPAVATQTIRRR